MYAITIKNKPTANNHSWNVTSAIATCECMPRKEIDTRV